MPAYVLNAQTEPLCDHLVMDVHDDSSGFRAVQDRLPNLLSLAEVVHRTGLSRSSLRRLEHAGRFPQRIRLSVRRVAWLESEVHRWIAWRCAEGRR